MFSSSFSPLVLINLPRPPPNLCGVYTSPSCPVDECTHVGYTADVHSVDKGHYSRRRIGKLSTGTHETFRWALRLQ